MSGTEGLEAAGYPTALMRFSRQQTLFYTLFRFALHPWKLLSAQYFDAVPAEMRGRQEREEKRTVQRILPSARQASLLSEEAGYFSNMLLYSQATSDTFTRVRFSPRIAKTGLLDLLAS
jgi:hypothetical protein